MLRLTDDQLDDAARLMVFAMDRAEREGIQTKVALGYLLVGALSQVYDITFPLHSVEDCATCGPLANDETDAAIVAIWENAYDEVEKANALFDWARGERP